MVQSHPRIYLRPHICIYIDRLLITTCVLLTHSFAPSLTVLLYKGDKERRAELQRETDTQDFHVLLTTYEVCLLFYDKKMTCSFFCVETDMFLSLTVVSQRCFFLEKVSLF